MIQPPRAGPTIEASPKTAIITPCQRPRSAGLKMSPMMAMAMGMIAPAPRPCTARNRIS